MMVRNTKSELGFSITELLVILLIIGVVSSAVLQFSPEGPSLKNQANQVSQLAYEAAMKALESGTEKTLSVDINNNTVSLDGTAKLSLSAKTQLSVLTGKNLLENQGRANIVFFPEGGATGGRITLRKANEAQEYQIEINWLTGSVRLLKTGDEH